MHENFMTNKATQVHLRLLEFYGEPVWRNPLPPVDELVSTILSQNTNDTNRDRAFDALREQFPTWEAVRDAVGLEVAVIIEETGKVLFRSTRDAVLAQPGVIKCKAGEVPVERARDEIAYSAGGP